MFDSFAPILAADRCVVVPDRIGFGHSDPLTRQLEIAEYAEATLDALDEVGVERFDVAGVHTGASEAIELAIMQPERVRRVALLGLIAFPPAEKEAFVTRDGPLPELDEDGTQLLWRWDRWCRRRPPVWSLEDMQRCLVDELRSSPWSQLSVNSVHSYRLLDRLPQVSQPLTVFAVHDYLWDKSARPALGSAPAGTRVVDVALDPPGSSPAGLFTFAAEAMAQHIRDFSS
jgi:pimeloyl-ACP methyl ester carboxylesterase